MTDHDTFDHDPLDGWDDELNDWTEADPVRAMCGAVRPVQPSDRADLRAALIVRIVCTKPAGHAGDHRDGATNVEWPTS